MNYGCHYRMFTFSFGRWCSRTKNLYRFLGQFYFFTVFVTFSTIDIYSVITSLQQGLCEDKPKVINLMGLV